MKNIKKKILVFVSSIEELSAQLKTINEYKENSHWEMVVFAGDYRSQKWLKHQGIKYKTSKDYLTNERHKKSFIEANRFIKEWYKKPEIENGLTYKGICLGKIFESMIRSAMQSFVTYIILYKTIMEIENPYRIFLIRRDINKIRGLYTPYDSWVDSYILSYIASQKGVEVHWVNSRFSIRRKLLEKLTEYIDKSSKMFSRIYKSLRESFYLKNYADIRIFNSLLRRINLPSKWLLSYLKRNKSSKNIFFYPDLRTMEAVASYIKNKKKYRIICLSGSDKISMERMGVYRIGLKVFNCRYVDEIVENCRKKLKEILQEEDNNDYFENFFCFEGVGFWPIAKPKIEYLFDVYFPDLVRFFELIKICHEEIGIDYFSSPGDQNPIVRMIYLALKQKNKPTLRVQHGFSYLTPEGTQLYKQYFIPIYPDKMMVWGRYCRDWYINNGVPKKKIVVFPSSDFDKFVQHNIPKERLHRCLEIKKGSKVILYALNHYHLDACKPYLNETGDEILSHLKDVIEVVSKIPNSFLIVRPHPEQDERNNRDIFSLIKDYKKENVIVSNIPFHFQIQACDILINYSSTAALEAMVLGKNVIVYNTTGRPELLPYVQNGAAIRITKKEDLLPMINRIYVDINFNHELSIKREEFVKHCIGEIDGQVTKNISEFIINEIK